MFKELYESSPRLQTKDHIVRPPNVFIPKIVEKPDEKGLAHKILTAAQTFHQHRLASERATTSSPSHLSFYCRKLWQMEDARWYQRVPQWKLANNLRAIT